MTPIWIFDYDGTLYGPSETGVFESALAAVDRYIASCLDLSPEQAVARRQAWRAHHGSIMRGLIHDLGEDPERYFDTVLADPLVKVPRPNPVLAEALHALPGPCYVLTNSREDWAERGLASLGVADRFERVFGLRFTGWRTKPDPAVYAMVADALRVDERRILFLDDRRTNLPPARARGWRSVWVHPLLKQEATSEIETLAAIERVATWFGAGRASS